MFELAISPPHVPVKYGLADETLIKSIDIARQRIRDGITEEQWDSLDICEQSDIAEEYGHELRLRDRIGTCSGNCLSTCLITSHRGENVCRWTYRPCPTFEIQHLLELYSIVNSRRSIPCPQQ